MENKERELTDPDINVCDTKNNTAHPGDDITWHNLRGMSVHVYFDTVDGCPLDPRCDFPIGPNGTYPSHVKNNAGKTEYHYRVVPECNRPGNPKIVIQ